MKKRKHKGMAVGPCPEHPGGHRPRPVTFTFDDEAPPAEVVFDAESGDAGGDRSPSVGYSKTYARGWDAVFGKKGMKS